jgi:hypothetical protein
MRRAPIPETWEALERDGWKFLVRTRCRECRRTIEFWELPSGRKMPLEKTDVQSLYVPHFAVCPYAEKFRSNAWKPKEQQPVAPSLKSSESTSSTKAKPILEEPSQKTLFQI